MAAPLPLWFKTFLLISLLIFLPSSSGLGMVEQGFQDVIHPKSSLQKGIGNNMIGMSWSRKLLTLGAMLDYDDTGANPKHDPRKKPGKP